MKLKIGTPGHGDGQHEDSCLSSSRVLRRQAHSARARTSGPDRPGELHPLQTPHRHHEWKVTQKVSYNSAQVKMYQNHLNHL